MSTSFPEKGKSRDEVLAALTQARARDRKSDGRAFAFVYDPGEEARTLAREAFAACMPINGLDPTVYPSARTLENGVVKACLELMHAPEGAVGTATAGGTESVMLAVKSAREFARKTRPEVTKPKMLLPVTAHACFHKAAHYLGVEVVPVDVHEETFRADVSDAERKMSADVILVVGSAPSYNPRRHRRHPRFRRRSRRSTARSCTWTPAWAAACFRFCEKQASPVRTSTSPSRG